MMGGMSATSSMPKRPSDPLDLVDVDSLLTDEEKAIRAATRQVCADVVDPYVMQWYEDGDLPVARELAQEFGKVGLLGMHLEGYGCAGTSATAYGLACLELEAGDSGLRSIVSQRLLRTITLTVDAYQIDINDRIALSSQFSRANALVAGYLNAAGATDVGIVQFFSNAIDTRTRGLDIVANERLTLSESSTLSLTAAANFTETEVRSVNVPSQLEDATLRTIFFDRQQTGRLEDARGGRGRRARPGHPVRQHRRPRPRPLRGLPRAGRPGARSGCGWTLVAAKVTTRRCAPVARTPNSDCRSHGWMRSSPTGCATIRSAVAIRRTREAPAGSRHTCTTG